VTIPGRFVVGIDGGASKTGALIASSDGIVVARRRAPGSAIVGRPHTAAIAVLDAVLSGLAEDAGVPRSAIERVVLGLSGVDYADEQPVQARDLAAGLGLDPARLVLVNDSIVALAGATSSARSTIVQHGTEVTLAYRAAPGAEQVFDSLGVADCFDLRHRAAPLVARMIDGRAPATPLRDAVLTHCGTTAERFGEWVLRSQDAAGRILTLAPVVFGCWAAGDPAAAFLVDQAVEDYVAAAAAMVRRLGPGPVTACFGGGTLSAGGPALLDAIAAALGQICPEAEIAVPAHAPEAGAALLALHGLDLPTDALLRRLDGGALIASDRVA
jgi:N-acetylglucosamine kinase-like BadF-type ATPase